MVKGAAGTAIHNMNIMSGFDETTGFTTMSLFSHNKNFMKLLEKADHYLIAYAQYPIELVKERSLYGIARVNNIWFLWSHAVCC